MVDYPLLCSLKSNQSPASQTDGLKHVRRVHFPFFKGMLERSTQGRSAPVFLALALLSAVFALDLSGSSGVSQHPNGNLC